MRFVFCYQHIVSLYIYKRKLIHVITILFVLCPKVGQCMMFGYDWAYRGSTRDFPYL